MTGKSVCLGVLVALLLSLAGNSTAIAARHHPTGIFAPFADCPISDPAVLLCTVINITGGKFVLGRKTVPIDRMIEIQGGWILDQRGKREFTLAAAEDGDTIPKTPLRVPGGLPGVGSVRSATEATVTPELAGPPSGVELSEQNLNLERGTALRLPLRAKLGSATLGDNCSVGSALNPLLLQLTTGTTSPLAPNKPIKGVVGESSNKEQDGFLALTVSDMLFVDNTFAAPAVSGCGSLYSPIVNSDIGLPAAAGRNTAVLTANVELATVEAVRASE